MNLRNFLLPPAVVTMADTPKIEKRLRAILESGQRSNGGAHRRIGRASVATAALLALAAFGSLAVLRPVAVRAQQPSTGGLNQEARTDEDRHAKQIACLNNLKIIGRSLVMYAMDYDEKLPPLTSNAALKNRLGPYVVGFYIRQGREQNRPDAFLTLPPLGPGPRLDVTPIFTCPETKKPYVPIAALSGKGLDRLSNPAFTMVVRDASPHPGVAYPNGIWNVVYADGHVKAERTLPRVIASSAAAEAADLAELQERRARLAREIAKNPKARLAAQRAEVAQYERMVEEIQRNHPEQQSRLKSVRNGLAAARRELARQMARSRQQRGEAAPVDTTDARARSQQQALVAQYAAEIAATRATLASITQLQQDRDRASNERVRSALERQSAQARNRLALAQAQLDAAQAQQEQSRIAARRNLAAAQARLSAAMEARWAAARTETGNTQRPRTFQIAYAVPADGKTHRLRIEVGDASGSVNTAIAEIAEPGVRFRKEVTARGNRVTLRLYDNDALKYERTR